MSIADKVNLLMLGEDEKKKVLEKFLTTLALVDENELIKRMDFLKKKGIFITKAREIKVLANPVEELSKKFSILEELGETDIYRQDVTMINKNVIDVYRRIKYCIQIGLPYKKEDGSYEPFLFSDIEWQKKIEGKKQVKQETPKEVEKSDTIPYVAEEEKKADATTSVEQPVEAQTPNDLTGNLEIKNSSANLESISDKESEVNQDNSFENNFEKELSQVVINDKKDETEHMDISEFAKMSEENKPKTINYDSARKELEAQLNLLDSLKNDLNSEMNDEISFDDISFGTGGRAA